MKQHLDAAGQTSVDTEALQQEVIDLRQRTARLAEENKDLKTRVSFCWFVKVMHAISDINVDAPLLHLSSCSVMNLHQKMEPQLTRPQQCFGFNNVVFVYFVTFKTRQHY